VVNAVMLRPLPFAAPSRLVRIWEKNDKLNIQLFSASVLNYLSWKEQTQTFAQMGVIGFASFNLTGKGDPEQLTGSTITPSMFPLLGLQPTVGRAFQEGDDKPGSPPAIMLSEGLWKRRFGGDTALIGKPVTLNGVAYTVVGIAPPALAVLTTGDIWVPLIIDPGREARLNHVVTAVGLLKPGVTLQQAQAEMETISRRVGMQYPEVKDWGIQLMTFHNWFVPSQLRTALLVLLGAVAFVLMIACANVANLLLSRAASRQKEIAVRTALGAGRGRLLRQLLTESLLLSLGGGGAGVLAAIWAVHVMETALPANLLPVSDLSVDSAVLLFALGITLATGLLFGMVPAWQTVKTDLNSVLKQGGRGSRGGSRPILRNSLVAGEMAVATVLLIGAGLLIQSLLHLQKVTLGFQSEGLLTFQLAPPAAKYPGPRAWAFYKSMLESLRALPGVRGAALSSGIPFGAGNYTQTPASPVGKSAMAPGEAIPINWRIASPDYFRTMGIPLLRGRDFGEQDVPAAPPVMIVSQETAKKLWGTADPLGRLVRIVGSGREFTVVGVVGDARMTALDQAPVPAMYFSAATRLWPLMDLVVRTAGKPESATASVRQKVHELDAELPLSNVRTMDQWISNGAAQPRLNTVLLGIFAAVALLIAAIGIYGVLSYSVNQRTREIGLRMALGAQQSSVLRMVVREGMAMGLAGIGAGLLAALAVSRALATLLFGVEPHDPATFLAVAGTLSAIALAACYLPARRAIGVDPAVALREE
jgi:putative ABC transport system permease protein